MAQQDQYADPGNNDEWLTNWPFTRIFQGFKTARQPSKLLLGLGGVILICLAGWIMDGLTSASSRVVAHSALDSQGGIVVGTEVDAYVRGIYRTASGRQAYRQKMRRGHEQQLKRILTASPMDMTNDAALELIQKGQAHEEIARKYDDQLDEALERLEKRYQFRYKDLESQYRRRIERASKGTHRRGQQEERCRKLEELDQAYLSVFNALTTGQSDATDTSLWVEQIIAPDPQAEGEDRKRDQAAVTLDRRDIFEALQLAQGRRTAVLVKGKGIFTTLAGFNSARLHRAVSALVVADLKEVKKAVWESLMSICWLSRFHWFYALVLMVMWLAIWAVVGGAICRIAALQVARGEQLGMWRAIQFSLGKFGSFFMAPLIPLGVIVLICLVVFLISWFVAIPGIGEIIGGVLLPVALLLGFAVALVFVGLIGGVNLMYPTIAVEGSDSVDAMSRSFGYVLPRPWRMGFYTLAAAAYGAICYLFVRFFAFLLLASVRFAAGAAVNRDGSSFIAIRGKLDAIWPAPMFGNLNPAVNWASLNWSESLGAFLIWIWVALIVALVAAFLVSFFFSVNTTIYYLLRKRVDGTEMDDVYLEHDIEELVAEAPQQEQAEQEESAEPAAEAETAAPPKKKRRSAETQEEKPEEDQDEDKNE